MPKYDVLVDINVEEKIDEKWNSMSTEDKAKALKIKKTVPKKASKKK